MNHSQRLVHLGRRRTFNRDRPDGGGRDGDTRAEAELRPRRGEVVTNPRYFELQDALSKTPGGRKLLHDLQSQRGETGAEDFLLANGHEDLVQKGDFQTIRAHMRSDNEAALRAADR